MAGRRDTRRCRRIDRTRRAVTRTRRRRCGSPCSAAASSAPRWRGCCTTQADDLAARVGAPLELVGIAVRRPDRRATPTSTAALFTTDADGAWSTRRRRHRGRGHRRHRAGPLAASSSASTHGAVGGHRQQGAARRGRRRRCTPRPSRPASTSTSRPPSPGPSRSSARCASRSPATGSRRVLGIVNGTTNFILDKMDTDGRRLRRGAGRGAGARATPRPTRPPTSRASTPPPRPRSWPASPSTPG